MKQTILGLSLAIGLMVGTLAASAQTNVSIWIGTAPVSGVQYQTYGNYYYYPNQVPGSFQVIYNPQYRAYGWWDVHRHWHAWAGPHVWQPVQQGHWHPGDRPDHPETHHW